MSAEENATTVAEPLIALEGPAVLGCSALRGPLVRRWASSGPSRTSIPSTLIQIGSLKSHLGIPVQLHSHCSRREESFRGCVALVWWEGGALDVRGAAQIMELVVKVWSPNGVSLQSGLVAAAMSEAERERRSEARHFDVVRCVRHHQSL